jgi:hypothetical protein
MGGWVDKKEDGWRGGYVGKWVAKLLARPACYGSSLGSKPAFSPKYKMGDISKGVANTL